jgi:DNA polymerase III subunit delta
VKATQKDFPQKAARAAQEAKVFFFCGPDEAGAHDAAALITGLLPESGERIELAGADLRKDPVLLGDEARSQSLFGDARHLFVRTQGDEVHDAVSTLLDSDVEICPVLIVASGATDKSRTAKLLSGRPDALVAMFYPPDLRAIVESIRRTADSVGVRLDRAIAERLALAARLDTRLARSETQKLALYLDASPEAPQTVRQEHVEAICAGTEDDGFASIVDAVLGGRADHVPHELQRVKMLGLSPVGLLLAFERRVAQLSTLSSRLRGQGDIYSLVETEASARRIRWQDKGALKQQLGIWHARRLGSLVDKLMALHQALLSNSRDSGLLLAHGLAQIASAISQKR